MKNLKHLRSFMSFALLSSVLLLLSGCAEWFGNKNHCPACASSSNVESAPAGDVLLSFEGKPAITKAKLDEVFDAYLRTQEGMYAAMDPQAKQRVFKALAQRKIIRRKGERDKLAQDPKYKKIFDTAIDNALDEAYAEVLGTQVLDSIETSDPVLEKFYTENTGKNPAFDNPPFLKTPEGIRLKIVQFNDEKSAKDFLAKAEKAGADFSALAKAIKKDVKDLGIVTSQTTFPQDIQKSLKTGAYSLKGKAKTLQPNETELITIPNGPFIVVRAVGPRQAGSYASWTEVIAAQPDFKEKLANYKKQLEGQQEFMKRIEEWKKDLKAEENTKYFEDEEARKKSELEAKFKELQAAQSKEAKPEAPKEQAPATVKQQATQAA